MDNPKNQLLNLCRQLELPVPTFETGASGPDHERVFICEVLIGDLKAKGQAKTKRGAEQAAAKSALQLLGAAPTESSTVPVSNAPMPVFSEVLMECLATANKRVATDRLGEDAVDEIANLTVKLYQSIVKGLS